jgi:glutathione S-transferase
MAKDADRSAGFALIESGTLAQFEVTSTHVEPSPDGETLCVRIEMQLGEPGEDDGEDEVDGEGEAEWAAFGFMYVLALLSFHDARPRGYSEKEYIEGDEFTVADFFAGLRFVRGELHLHLDYIRGRCVKTAIRVRRDGVVTLETWSRGESAVHWTERLKGKKPLQLVS